MNGSYDKHVSDNSDRIDEKSLVIEVAPSEDYLDFSSLSDMSRKICESIDISGINASIAASCRQIAQILEPCSSLCRSFYSANESALKSMDRITEAAKAITIPSAALEGLSAATENVAKMADTIQESLIVSPEVTKSLESFSQALSTAAMPLDDQCLKAISAIPVRQLKELSSGLENLPAIADTGAKTLEIARETALENSEFSQAALNPLSSLASEEFGAKIHHVVRRLFSRVSSGISHIKAFLEIPRKIFEMFQEELYRILEISNSIVDGLCRLAARSYRSAREKISLLFDHGPPWHLSIKEAAALVNIGFFSPEQIREYAVQSRKTYLQNRQRISDDSDDFDNDYVFAM